MRTAPSVADARDSLEQAWIQAVPCDQHMPDMSGVEFLRVVREDWLDIDP